MTTSLPALALPQIPTWTPPTPPPAVDVKAQYDEAFKACKTGGLRRYFDFEDDGSSFTMDTRDGGSVGDETPGKGDIKAAGEIRASIQLRFALLSTSFETVDEWTSVTVHCKPRPAPAPPLHGKEFWQGVLDVAVVALEAAGYKLLGEAGFLSGESIRLHLPIFLREKRNSQTAEGRGARLALETLFRAPGYKGGCGYVEAGGQLAGLELDTLPAWARKP